MSQITDEQVADLKDRSLNLRAALAAASNAFGYANPDLGDYVRLQIAIAAYLSALSTPPVGAETGEPVAWPGRKFCEIAERNISELAKFIKGEDDKLACTDAALAIRTLLSAPPRSDKANGERPTGHFTIAHDGFSGTVIGHYERLDGKRGVVMQQDGTKVVHVYGEKWLSTSPAVPNTVGEDKRDGNDQASSAVASEVIDITDEYITKVLNGFHGTRYWLHMTKAEVRAALSAAKGAGEAKTWGEWERAQQESERK